LNLFTAQPLPCLLALHHAAYAGWRTMRTRTRLGSRNAAQPLPLFLEWPMTSPDGFQLSRIYAEGWKAGSQLAPITRQPIQIANPYGDGPERARWNDGFADARKRHQAS